MKLKTVLKSLSLSLLALVAATTKAGPPKVDGEIIRHGGIQACL